MRKAPTEEINLLKVLLLYPASLRGIYQWHLVNTYSSKLYDSGEVPESFMMEQMGHTDISCLMEHYYYNRMNEEKRQILNQVKAL